MSRVFFRRELENVATFWQIYRRDGVALGFTTHDRNLRFDGLLHRSAPGLLPSAIRRTADLADDGADISGAISHDTISDEDLADGRFDQAKVVIGAVDWENLERIVLYVGAIDSVTRETGRFTTRLRSAKAMLDVDPVPRSSPSCRAVFCDTACTLSAARFTTERQVVSTNLDRYSVAIEGIVAADYRFGTLRWIDGPLAGLTAMIRATSSGELVLDRSIDPQIRTGCRVVLREGCDHRLSTCAGRFGNAANFQGEPFLPGNDLLAQYPTSR
ncbi:DUF2163 domain-containing protein [Altererythrobacter aurantiacus]|uniref:DUF2163 domain-containing protein n=1 Tax=Parapontixanthobacter aurantiacus TaxID=1463599 RepID=A0A844ZKF0_9SPHN|nr:DUF2163 domain-containing protein [Parapontixanthobacter aurantiacus]MXO86169.1 DUF2163 domain-containing protein [Parapontixanthobacter aurantiacus]